MAQVNSGHRVCVVMPTYNERDNLEPTLTDLFLRNAGVDVLIVDDYLRHRHARRRNLARDAAAAGSQRGA